MLHVLHEYQLVHSSDRYDYPNNLRLVHQTNAMPIAGRDQLIQAKYFELPECMHQQNGLLTKYVQAKFALLAIG
ncbi:hypothetical protein D9M71_438540 [compost metagenome]